MSLFSRGVLYLLLISLIGIFFLLIPKSGTAQEAINPLIHPGNRYARENTSLDVLAHWVGPVTAQIIGKSDIETQKIVLSDLLYLGRAARVDLNLYGFPNTVFSNTDLASDARIVILTYESKFERSIHEGLAFDEYFGAIGFSNPHPEVSNILKSGLVQQADGCFAKWRASNSNEIQGVVIAASNALSPIERQVCFSSLMPPIFGISSVASLYNAMLAVSGSRPDEVVVFDDRSELVFELSVAATCRFDLNDFGAMCPIRLTNQIFKHHSYLKKLKVNLDE